MNGAHVHLLLTHLPVLGTLFGLGLGAYAILFRKEDVLKASLGVFVGAGLLAGAAYLTGEGAEEAVEAWGVAEALVEPHESSAVLALVAAAVLGLVSLAGLVLYRARTVARPFAVVAMGLALAVAGVMTYTANLGGQIRHAEIRGGTPAQVERIDGRPMHAGELRHDDDD
jgi:uncharacterized membrane protein